MTKELIHIYGPFSIQSFGFIIAIGLILFTWLIHRHPLRKKLMNSEQFYEIVLLGIVSGIIGGRLLYILQAYHSMDSFFDGLKIWEGGFSILGTLTAVLLTIGLYLKKNKISVLPFLDLIALYGALFQSISRIGCFFAGCCFGLPTNLPWAIMYNDCSSLAPLHTHLHPTQLYSSLSLFFIFLFIRFYAAQRHKKPGQLTSLYLFLASVERFTVSFWRADREYFSYTITKLFSIHQWLALILGMTAVCFFFYTTLGARYRKS